MRQVDLDAIRQQLLEMSQRTRADVNALTVEVRSGTEMQSSGDLTNSPVEDRAERGSDSSDSDVAIGLLELESDRLSEVQAALGRLHAGKFGHCESCARAISRERLRAIPFARLCIDCASKAQRGQPTNLGNL